MPEVIIAPGMSALWPEAAWVAEPADHPLTEHAFVRPVPE